jgi:GntR family transcriptional regulator, transcriptional repressor for pyruvate dehydrogenase complex
LTSAPEPALTDGESGMEPIHILAARDLVLEQIRTALALGRFRPGDTLPSERDLASMLQVSRTVVREAVAVLNAEGVLEVRRGRSGGIFVSDRQIDEPTKLRMLRENSQRLRETFEYRVIVESAGARFAAERRTEEELAALQRCVEDMRRISERLAEAHDPKGIAEFFAVDHDFHLGIARASRNAWLANATLAARVEMFRPVGCIFERLEPEANHLHEQICGAIEAGDGELASDWMRQHIEETRASIEPWLRAPDDPAGGRDRADLTLRT